MKVLIEQTKNNFNALVSFFALVVQKLLMYVSMTTYNIVHVIEEMFFRFMYYKLFLFRTTTCLQRIKLVKYQG